MVSDRAKCNIITKYTIIRMTMYFHKMLLIIWYIIVVILIDIYERVQFPNVFQILYLNNNDITVHKSFAFEKQEKYPFVNTLEMKKFFFTVRFFPYSFLIINVNLSKLLKNKIIICHFFGNTAVQIFHNFLKLAQLRLIYPRITAKRTSNGWECVS